MKNISIVPKLRASVYLEIMLLSAALTVFIIRNFLSITYADPVTTHLIQLFSGMMIVLMAVALVLTVFGKYIDMISAMLAGLGFGVMMEELAHFAITGAIYDQTIPTLYFTFILGFFLIRYLLLSRKVYKKDYLVNSMELIQDALVTDQKDKIAYEKFDFFLKQVGTKNSIGQHLQQIMYSEFEVMPAIVENSWSKKLERCYGLLLEKKIVEVVLILFFVGLTGFTSYYLLNVILGGWPVDLSTFSKLDLFLLISTGFILLGTLGGIVQVLIDKRNNYRPLESILYLSIFLQQVFIFDYDQLVGAVVLILSIIGLVAIKYMIHLEQRYANLHLLGRENIIEKSKETLRD